MENKFDDIDFKKIFGHSYYDFMKKIFDKFKKSKDLILIKNWEIPHYIDIEVLENIFYSIKRIWLEDPENHIYGLEKLIANTFAKASLEIDNYLNIINDYKRAFQLIYSCKYILQYYIELIKQKMTLMIILFLLFVLILVKVQFLFGIY